MSSLLSLSLTIGVPLAALIIFSKTCSKSANRIRLHTNRLCRKQDKSQLDGIIGLILELVKLPPSLDSQSEDKLRNGYFLIPLANTGSASIVSKACHIQ